MTTRTPANAVRTSNRAYTFYLEKVAFRGNHYYMAKGEMRLAFIAVFERKVQEKAIVYSPTIRLSFVADSYGDTRSNFFNIGCMKFSRNATVKIAKWVGFSSTWIKSYLPA